MEIVFWGVRGSIATPGLEYNRYGGNTSCVSVHTDDGTLVILDAGTGITVLGRQLMGMEFGEGKGRATLLLTHAHWDHIQGFPFFAPALVAGNRVTIFGPSESPRILEEILEGQFNPHFSPLHSLRNLASLIELKVMLEQSEIHIGKLTITGRFNSHGRYRSLAYRIQEGPCAVVYAPDTAYPQGDPPPQVQQLYSSADFLIHDCTYSPEDFEQHRTWGHSSIAQAARVAALCRVRSLVMFHYDQDYTDPDVDRLRDRCRGILDTVPGGRGVELIAAQEGLRLRTG